MSGLKDVLVLIVGENGGSCVAAAAALGTKDPYRERSWRIEDGGVTVNRSRGIPVTIGE